MTQNPLRTNLPTQPADTNTTDTEREKKKKDKRHETAPADTTEWRDADVEATAAEAGTRVTATAASIATSCAIGYQTPNVQTTELVNVLTLAVIPPLLCKVRRKREGGEIDRCGRGRDGRFAVALRVLVARETPGSLCSKWQLSF